MQSARIPRLIALAVACVCAVAAEAGIKSERLLASIVSRTPAPRLVAAGSELAEAEKHAATLANAQAFRGVGNSMEPFYAPNTAIVVQGISFNDIKKGMTVVYQSRRGNRVAHSVVGETRGGFITQGVNNNAADPELVTERNFIGVVVNAFSNADTAFRTDTARKLASRSERLAAAS